MIDITINGDPYRLPEDTTLGALVGMLGMKPARIAVELNHRVIMKAEYPTVTLSAGDKVEIINFVGGG